MAAFHEPPQRVGLVAAEHREQAVEAARWALDWLQAAGREVVLEAATAAALDIPGAADPFTTADLLVVCGGDGSVVSAARAAAPAGIPVIGVNFGTFGFLAEIPAVHLPDALASLAAGQYVVEPRMMLHAALSNSAGELVFEGRAANDVVVKGEDPGRVLEMVIRADGNLIAEFPADGVMLATPTGSTAYNLSAGGPVVVPGVEAMVLTPICPHTLTSRPVVLSAETEVVVEVVDLPRFSRAAIVTLDGQIHYELCPGSRLAVTRAKVDMLLARLPGADFFQGLREKLRWGSPK